jgi:hypothetical protein
VQGGTAVTIWKFYAPIDDKIAIAMPADAKILSVQTQDETPYIWALVDQKKQVVMRAFAWRGTGHPADNLTHEMFVGTIQLDMLVFHLFDLGEVKG